MTDRQKHIDSVSDFRGRRIGVGAAASGTEVVARIIIEAHGLQYADVEPEFLSFSEVAEQLEKGSIDAGFVVASYPVAAIADASRIVDIRLIPVAHDVVDRIRGEYPFPVPPGAARDLPPSDGGHRDGRGRYAAGLSRRPARGTRLPPDQGAVRGRAGSDPEHAAASLIIGPGAGDASAPSRGRPVLPRAGCLNDPQVFRRARGERAVDRRQGNSGPTAGHVLALVSGARIAWSSHVRTGEPFSLSFEHSAEKCRWTQHYVVASGGRIEQVSSTFPCIGAGMPWSSSDGSPAVRTMDGYTLAALRLFHDIHMRNSLRAWIVLSVGDQRVDVSRLFDDFPAVHPRAAMTPFALRRPNRERGGTGVKGRRWSRAGLALSLALLLALATGTLFWLAYRAATRSEQATRMAVDRRSGEVLVLVIAALERDMKGVQTSVLLPIDHRSLVPDPPYDLADRFARAFAQFPYPESFFTWNAGPNGETPTSSIAPIASLRGTPRFARWIRTPS